MRMKQGGCIRNAKNCKTLCNIRFPNRAAHGNQEQTRCVTMTRITQPASPLPTVRWPEDMAREERVYAVTSAGVLQGAMS
jgi:hypothetical protein